MTSGPDNMTAAGVDCSCQTVAADKSVCHLQNIGGTFLFSDGDGLWEVFLKMGKWIQSKKKKEERTCGRCFCPQNLRRPAASAGARNTLWVEGRTCEDRSSRGPDRENKHTQQSSTQTYKQKHVPIPIFLNCGNKMINKLLIILYYYIFVHSYTFSYCFYCKYTSAARNIK